MKPKERTPPTCTKGFGHEPCEACADFSFVKIIMLKRFNCRNNKSLFPVAGLAEVPHVETPAAGESQLHSSSRASDDDDILPKESNAPI